jgi:hypothetical protein
MEQHWVGLGGGGLRVGYDILRELHSDGYIQINGGSSSDQPKKPPTSSRKNTKEEKYTPYISTPDGKINITFYGMDTDDQILSSLEEVDSDDYANILHKHENYIHLLQGRGAGTGGVPKRILEIAESNEEIKSWIRKITSNMSGVFNPSFSLDGGSGFGFFKLHTQMMSDTQIERPSTVMPLAISPHRTEANRKVSWPKQDISRKASDNVDLATEYIGDRMGGRGGLIDFCILVDNDFAAFNQLCNENHNYDYDYVFEKTLPILEDLNYSEFNSTAKNNLNHQNANSSIVRSVKPLYTMLTRGPRGEKFGKVTQQGFDHNDLKSMFENYVVPSNLTLSSKSRVADIFAGYDLEGYDQKIAYLSYYTFLLSCAPMDANDITDVTIFVWDSGQSQSIGGQTKEEILNLFSGVGMDSDDISVHPVVGLADPNAEIKIWTYSSVEEMNHSLVKKFH